MHGVTLTLDVDGVDPTTELLSFANWLDAIAALRGRYELVRSAPQAGTMDGGAFSHLLTQLADPQAISAVLIGLWQWQRGRLHTVTMKVTNRSGAEVKVVVNHLTRKDLDERLPEWTELIQNLQAEDEDDPLEEEADEE